MSEEILNNISSKAAIEALLFVSEKPLMIEQIKSVFENLDASQVKKIILELKSDYENTGRGLRIEEIAGGFQIVTALETTAALKKFYKLRDSKQLSGPSLETLAIIAYKQPLTRLDIESLRGVNVDAVLKGLLEKNLIRISGRKDIPGRPFVYGTTRQFLEYFGLSSLNDLPRLEEFAHPLQPQAALLSLSNKSSLETAGQPLIEKDASNGANPEFKNES